MKRLLSMVVITLMLVLLAAQCGAAAPEPAAEKPAAEKPAAEAEKPKEPAAEEKAEAEKPAATEEAKAEEAAAPAGEEVTLIVAVPDDIQTLDTCCTNFIRGNQAEAHVYDQPVIHATQELEGGVRVGDTSQMEGMVFESWERQENGTDIKVKIRQGLKFHNGKEITAEAVAYMLERALNTKGGMNWLATNIMSVSKPPTVDGKYELTIHTDRPNPLTIPAMYMSGAGIFDPEEVKANATSDDPWAEKWMAKNVAGGSGPFKIESWTPDQEVVFRAVPDYWRGKSKIDKLVWKIVPSPATRVTLLMNGAVDVVEGLTTEELNALKDKPGVKILTVPSKNMAYLGMNNNIEPFKDQKVRQAVSYAIDYQDIIDSVYNGEAQRLKSPLPSGSEYADGSYWKYDTNVETAKSLLSEAGHADGLEVTLNIDSSNAQHELIAVRVQSHLKEAGINVTIEKLASSVFAEKKVGKELPFFVDESLAWVDDPNYVLSLTLQCDVFGNYTAYCNKKVDDIIKNGWTELDKDKRFKMFQEAQQMIVEDAPWVFLTQPDFHLAMRENVHGYVHYLNEIVRYYDFYKE